MMKLSRRAFIAGSLGAAGAAIATGGAAAAFVKSAPFGRAPSPERLKRMQASPNWRDGAFRNLEPLISPPPVGPDGKVRRRDGRLKVWWKFLFADKSALFPPAPIPVSREGAAAILGDDDDFGVWLGHSSVFLRLGGKNILIDPVFSSYASPVPFINRAFPVSGRPWSADDFPEIDLLVISHDHWDHLDYPSVTALMPKVKEFACPLGVGEYLEAWGAEPGKVREGDWWETLRLCDGEISATLTPGRHFSGRFERMNMTLWAGFAFSSRRSPLRIYFSGDGGWGSHVAEIGRRIGGFDLAFLENGQYNENWPLVHMAPKETALTASTIRARAVVPIHNSRFALSRHSWCAPLDAICEEAAGRNWRLLTPQIGQSFRLDDAEQPFPKWWKDEMIKG